jgi:hypothetical protein
VYFLSVQCNRTNAMLAIESLQTTDMTTQTLGPILNEVKTIVSGATDKVKALAGGVNASGDVSVGDVASEVAPLVNVRILLP